MIGKRLELIMRFLQFLFHKVSVEEHFMECHSKCDYFLKFFDKNIKANIFQSNLYVQQKQKGKSILPVKERLYGSMALWDTISYHHGLITGNEIQILQFPVYPVLYPGYVLVRFCAICMWMLIAQFQQRIKTNCLSWDHWLQAWKKNM